MFNIITFIYFTHILWYNMLIGGIKADILDYRDEIIKLALEQLEKPYNHNEYGPDSFDCAGFLSYVFGEVFDIDLFEEGFGGSTTGRIMTCRWGKREDYKESDDIKFKLTNIEPGDILLFHSQSPKAFEPKKDNRYPGHCGIYLGDEEFIHCAFKKQKVCIDNFENKRYQKILVASIRIKKEDV